MINILSSVSNYKAKYWGVIIFILMSKLSIGSDMLISTLKINHFVTFVVKKLKIATSIDSFTI